MGTSRSHVCCTNEQGGCSANRVECHTIEDGFKDDEYFDDSHEYLDSTRRSNGLISDTFVGDELIVHCDRLPDIAVPHPNRRRSSEVNTCLLIPQIDAEEGPPSHFVFDRVETVERFGISVQSKVDGKGD